MYKMIVVDDNKRELGYVQSALDWRQHKIEIVGTYTSPLEALQQIPELMPDIILSDVVMPHMNGFELISQALTFNPDMLNIFMSCHEDFQYAKAAVDASACSYLLKPLIQEELEETICKTVSRLEQKEMERLKNSSMEEMIAQSLDGLREQFFFELSSGEFSSKDEVGERMKLLQLGNLLDSDICIINLKFQREHEVFQQMEARRSYYNLFYTQKILSESFTFAKAVQKFSKSSETLTCVLFLDRQASAENHASIDETVISLVEQISGELKGNIVVGISNIANDLLQLPVLYAQSITALEANFFAGINPIIWYHEVAETFEKPAVQKGISIDALSHQLKRVWISGSREKVEEFVDEVFSVATDYSEYRIRSLALTMINVLELQLLQDEIKLQELFPDDIGIWKKIFNFDKYFNVKQLLVNIICEAIAYQKQRSNSTNHDIVAKIKEIIGTYYVEPITVSEIATKVFFSASYANNIFKEVTGKTIFDYLTEYRIEMAMFLLKQPHCIASVVSEQVGYSNKSHFSLIFKKYVGYSPADYRKRMLKGAGEDGNQE